MESSLCQVNVNFGTHNCVHMGTAIEAEIAAYEPSAVSWPAEDGQFYTLVSLVHKMVQFALYYCLSGNRARRQSR